jgi:hypothetical protein
MHEEAGERMLLDSGLPRSLARVCKTHARWSEPPAVLEDRLIALADKLWKGRRDTELERALVDELAGRLAREPWDVFCSFDARCEGIARAGPARLARSDPRGDWGGH